MEKIAIHCKSAEEWFSVEKEAFRRGFYWYSGKEHQDWWDEDRCINIESNDLAHSLRPYYEDNGYKIISAAEYLNEGGKDVSEFKKGDRVECIAQNNLEMLVVGKIYIVAEDERCSQIRVEDEKFKGYRPFSRSFKLATKTQTTKENNMNISDNILTVFEKSEDAKKVANRFGDQYGNTDRDLLALKRDKKDLLAIIKDEEEAAAKD